VIRVMLIDDVLLLRTALAAVLSNEIDIKVVADLASSDDVAPIAEALRPDVAVIDFDPRGCAALAAARALGLVMPGCGVLALTSVRPAGPVRRLLASTVQGVLGKDTEPCQVAQAIRKVARGDRVIDPALAVAAMLVPQGPLTPRELDVLRVAAEGVPTAEIASRLHLSCGTVRNYVSSALRKTGARNRLEAARIADDAGWL